MKIDWKKVKSVALTYAVLALPLATAAFAMKASALVKILTFLSGLLPVIVRQANPKDPFTLSLISFAKNEIDAQIEKQAKAKK